MTKQPTPEEICEEISTEVAEMAGWLSGGDLSPEQFRLGLTRLEDRKLQRFGLKLSSSTSDEGVVHFTFRFAGTGEFCAGIDIDPATGAMTIQRSCG